MAQDEVMKKYPPQLESAIMVKPEIQPLLEQVEIVIFDVDGTLADIRDSYERSIRGATSWVLQQMGIYNIDEQQLATSEALYPLWQRPALSDVWYLTYAATAYYQAQLIVNNRNIVDRLQALSDIPTKEPLEERIKQGFDKEHSNLRAVSKGVQGTHISYNFSDFVQLLLDVPGEDKIAIIQNTLKRFFATQDFTEEQVQDALKAHSKIWSPHLMKSVFQQMFMDDEAYKAEYGEPFIKCRGDWNNDATTIPVGELQSLLSTLQTNGYRLGIATARPRSELQNFLDRFTLAEYFNPQAIKSNEDGSKSKRIRDALKALAEIEDLTQVQVSAIYVADTVGDIQAVQELREKEMYPIAAVIVRKEIGNQNLENHNRNTIIQAGTDIYIPSLLNLAELLPERG